MLTPYDVLVTGLVEKSYVPGGYSVYFENYFPSYILFCMNYQNVALAGQVRYVRSYRRLDFPLRDKLSVKTNRGHTCFAFNQVHSDKQGQT